MIWNLDEFGNPVIYPKEDELKLNYQVSGQLYIRIQNYNLYQSNLMEYQIFLFQIYMYGKSGSVTNAFAYTDIRDCLDDAMKIIQKYKKSIEAFFNRQEDQELPEIFEDDFGRLIQNLDY